MTAKVTVETETFRKLYHMDVDGNDWEQWRARIWNQLASGLRGYPGLAPLEQWMLRSAKERRCVQCGEPGEVEEDSVLVASVRRYWLCGSCYEPAVPLPRERRPACE